MTGAFSILESLWCSVFPLTFPDLWLASSAILAWQMHPTQVLSVQSQWDSALPDDELDNCIDAAKRAVSWGGAYEVI